MTCASLLVALDVDPRVAMQILRHSQIAGSALAILGRCLRALRLPVSSAGCSRRPSAGAARGSRHAASLFYTGLLRTLLVPVEADDAPTLEELLEIADSAITYRTR